MKFLIFWILWVIGMLIFFEEKQMVLFLGVSFMLMAYTVFDKWED